MFVATGDGGGGASERRTSGAAAAAMGEVVGDDSMVVGKGIMIKGDVDDCAVRTLKASREQRRNLYTAVCLFLVYRRENSVTSVTCRPKDSALTG